MVHSKKKSMLSAKRADADKYLSSGELHQDIITGDAARTATERQRMLNYLENMDKVFKEKMGRHPRNVNEVAALLGLSNKSKKKFFECLIKTKSGGPH